MHVGPKPSTSRDPRRGPSALQWVAVLIALGAIVFIAYRMGLLEDPEQLRRLVATAGPLGPVIFVAVGILSTQVFLLSPVVWLAVPLFGWLTGFVFSYTAACLGSWLAFEGTDTGSAGCRLGPRIGRPGALPGVCPWGPPVGGHQRQAPPASSEGGARHSALSLERHTATTSLRSTMTSAEPLPTTGPAP